MIEELLRKFSRENFDDANYMPLLHGHSETAKPLSLIIKQKRSIWKRPFAKDEITILAGLEKYVSSDCKQDYLEAVKLKVVEEQVMEKGKNAPVGRYKEFINKRIKYYLENQDTKLFMLIANFTINCVLSFIDFQFEGKLGKYARILV